MAEDLKPPASSRIFAISGPTGAGKTTLARALLDLVPNLTLVSEPTMDSLEHLWQAGLWHDMQQAIVRHRAAALSRASSPIIVMDRSFSEDRIVFFQLHRALGHLSTREYEDLLYETSAIENSLPSPSQVVFLRPTEGALLARMNNQGQPDWLMTSIDHQLRLYDRWLQAQTAPVLIVDTQRQQADGLAVSVWKWIVSA